jgi:hypothetical protein
MHAPPDTEFGGDAEVEARLRRALMRVTREAQVETASRGILRVAHAPD